MEVRKSNHPGALKVVLSDGGTEKEVLLLLREAASIIAFDTPQKGSDARTALNTLQREITERMKKAKQLTEDLDYLKTSLAPIVGLAKAEPPVQGRQR